MQALRKLLFVAYGSQNFTRAAYLKNAKHFPQVSEEDSAALKGKVCVVTGANQGIGKAAALALAQRGAKVHLVCRNKERGEEAAKDIAEKSGNQSVVVEIRYKYGPLHKKNYALPRLKVCDLSSLSDIRSLVHRLQDSPDSSVHVLVNNAGIMEQQNLKSPDGFEMNFAVNVLGTFALTEWLLPALRRGGPDAKVITVATGGILSETLNKDLQGEKNFDGTEAYAKNKRVQVALVEKWGEKFGNEGIGFYSMHPGWVDTTTLKNSMPGFYSTFKSSLRTPQEGADTIDWLACAKNSALKQGGFYFDRKEAAKHLGLAGTQYKPKDVEEIYETVSKMAGPL